MIKYMLILSILLMSCTNAPRYRIGSEPGKKRTVPLITKGKHSKVVYGVSSFYAEDFHGKLTANGEVYDMYGLTAAHKTLPLNTIIRVTNMENDKSIILRINDRGPYVAGRILDCSYGAAVKLGFIAQGTTKVKIEIIEFGDNKYMKHKDG
ncbi:MAG: septal ring lytic transglycosylase RlpA family protein [Candidatus Marinimicrobia bacterium]|nr:septal ring lytic transglycosylase RlpA family protein [Candidatus Neomarinimicrobiota bacterium]MCH7763943.1 septal ring lytic transglycosylase RlpA family protein [Candidatus Neomarinimicrobiota bacterium]